MKIFRPSSYTISVKLDDPSAEYMLIHGYSGAVDFVTTEVANFLSTPGRFAEEDVPFSKKTFESLLSRGYITKKSAAEERKIVQLLAGALHKRAKSRASSFMFILTYKCNLRCVYCYEKDTLGIGDHVPAGVFTKEMVDTAYDAMLQLQPDKKRHSKTITLFGGEPLLKENKEIVKYIVDKGKELGYHFTAVTNGYDLEHFEDLLGPDQISLLQITVDGAKRYHD